MRVPALLIAILSCSVVHAANPTTRPLPKAELELLGPVRLANYTKPFVEPKADPNAVYYSNRHTYNTPPGYGFYGCYGGYGYGWYGWYGCGYGRGYWGGPYLYRGGVEPSGMFYGD